MDDHTSRAAGSEDVATPSDLQVAAYRLDRVLRWIDEGCRLRPADRRLVWALADGRPRTMRELATLFQLEQSTVNRQVNAAVAGGVVERADLVEGSMTFVAAERARRDLERDVEALDAQLGRALAVVPHDRRAQFVIDLAAYVDRLDADVRRSRVM